jgi:hypothetical protein
MAIDKSHKKAFDKVYQESLNALKELTGKGDNGKKIVIDVEEKNEWIKDDNSNAQHFTIQFPPEIRPEGKLIIGYLGKDYHGQSELPFDRKLHVLKGAIKNGTTVHSEDDGPFKVKANEILKLESNGESIIVIDLIPNA